MKSFFLILSLISVTFAVADFPSQNNNSPEPCEEDEFVVKRITDVMNNLKDAFDNYVTLMRTMYSCREKREAFVERYEADPWTYHSLFAVINAVYDRYVFPLNSGEHMCEEDPLVIRGARNVVKRLSDAFFIHTVIMNDGRTCEKKYAEVRRLTEAHPKLHRSLRGLYLASSKYYQHTSDKAPGSVHKERIEIPTDSLDKEKHRRFRRMLEDVLLYTKVTFD